MDSTVTVIRAFAANPQALKLSISYSFLIDIFGCPPDDNASYPPTCLRRSNHHHEVREGIHFGQRRLDRILDEVAECIKLVVLDAQ